MTTWAEDYLAMCVRAHGLRTALKSFSASLNWTMTHAEKAELEERKAEMQSELHEVEAAMKQMRYTARGGSND